MNVTDGIVCDICQTSYGFSSADRRAIIVMVVLAAIAVLSCYVGVLWFAIRTRYKPEKTSNVIDSIVHNNEAYDIEEAHNEDNVQYTIETPKSSILPPTTTRQSAYSISGKSSP